MSELINKISHADASCLESILQAILARYREVFPDWEIITVSFEKNGDRNAQIDQLIDLLQNIKISSK